MDQGLIVSATYFWFDSPSKHASEKENELLTLRLLTSNEKIFRTSEMHELMQMIRQTASSEQLFLICSASRIEELSTSQIVNKFNNLFRKIIVYCFNQGKKLDKYVKLVYRVAYSEDALISAMRDIQAFQREQKKKEDHKCQEQFKKASKEFQNISLEEKIAPQNGNFEMMEEIGGSAIWIDKSVEYNLHIKENLSSVMKIQCFTTLQSAIMYLADHTDEVKTLIFANNIASQVFSIIPLQEISHYIIYCGNQTVAYSILQQNKIDFNDPRFFVTSVENKLMEKIKQLSGSAWS